MRIYKYEIEHGRTTVPMTPGRVLSFQMQGDSFCVWAEHHPEKPEITRTFQIVGTGWDVDDAVGLSYVGTVQCGGYVWHCYEETPR